MMKLIFCLQINVKCFFKFISPFYVCVCVSGMPKLPKLAIDEVYFFLHADKHESLIHTDTMI